MSAADAPRPWMQITMSRAAAWSGPRRTIGCPRCGSVVIIAFDYVRASRFVARQLAATSARRVARHLRYPAHVDANRRQGSPRADAAHQSLLEHRVPDFRARTRHPGDADRQSRADDRL